MYSRVASLVFEVLDHQNKDNIYPFSILFSDLISNSNRTALMEYLNRYKICASPCKYGEYKKTMASRVKERREAKDMQWVF